MNEILKTQLAKEIWRNKYKYNNEDELETQIRVASSLASIEKNKKYWEEKFLNCLVKFDENKQPLGLKCTTGGRITANIGTSYKNASLFNCYVSNSVKNATIKYIRKVPNTDVKIPVIYESPDTGDDMINIILTLLEQSLTLGSEGGWGTNFSFIRPRGAIIKGIGIEHPGIVKFLEVFDKMADIIVSGNNDGFIPPLKDITTIERVKTLGPKKEIIRKGAMMACLSCDHPDIEEFVLAKQKGGRFTKFNFSVLITDDFMNKVAKDENFDLVFDGKIYKTIKAKELYDLIMKSTYNKNEPGVLFYDNMQKNNPLSYLGPVDATNPCGEVPGNSAITTCCLLGSINLTQYITLEREFDWNQYIEDIHVFVRMLDNVNDLQKRDLPAYLWNIKNVRQIGVGLNGFGSMLYMLGVPYNSKKAIDLAEKLNRIKLNECLKASALLAKEKGKAKMFNKNYFKTYYWNNYLKGKLDDQTIKLVKKYGLRNCKLTTSPPLGNSSVLCDNISNGLEPVFTHQYERTYIVSNWPEGLNQDNIKNLLKKIEVADVTCWEGEYNGKFYYYEPHNRGLCIKEKVNDYGYKWILDNYPEEINKKYLISSSDLKIDDHINIQLAFQKYIDQAVSKTCIIPNDYPYEDFKNLYKKAWKNGLLGFTTYREGTMESVLSKIEEVKEISEHLVIRNVRLPKKFINGPCEIIKREGIKYYIHFSYLEEDKEYKFPIAIWLQTNHVFTGEAVYVNRAMRSLENLLTKYEIEDQYIDKLYNKCKNDPPNYKLAKYISMCLRHNLPILDIVLALENLEGDNISTILTAVRKFLSKHIENGTKVKGKKCPACNSEKIIYESGCIKCLDCGEGNCG
jgi:ribonucleoside-diphosphate reductase alpha chain